MNKRILVSPSMMCADITKTEETVKSFEKAKIDYLHIDVMDGEFVPNIALGTDYIKKLRKVANIPLDIHLMIKNPEKKLDWFDIQKTDIVSVHYESTENIEECLEKLSLYGCKRYLAINPETDVSVVVPYLYKVDGILNMTVHPGFAGQKMVDGMPDKVQRLKTLLCNCKKDDLIIEVDGNISPENGKLLYEAGAKMFVLGTSGSFYGNIKQYKDNVMNFKRSLK